MARYRHTIGYPHAVFEPSDIVDVPDRLMALPNRGNKAVGNPGGRLAQELLDLRPRLFGRIHIGLPGGRYQTPASAASMTFWIFEIGF